MPELNAANENLAAVLSRRSAVARLLRSAPVLLRPILAPGLVLAVSLAACAGPASPPPRLAVSPPPASVPFTYLGGHFLVVAGRVGGVETRFILDTGMGVNLLSEKLCQQVGCTPTGDFTGQRMSGQDVPMKMAKVASLSVGTRTLENVPVGVFDFEANHFGVDPSIDGFLSLAYFRDVAFTLDYGSGTLVIEDADSLQERLSRGRPVPVRLSVHGPAVDVFMPLQVAQGVNASVEVDTGSPALILDEKYLVLLGIDPNDERVKRKQGTDETGYAYTRFFPRDPVPVRALTTPASASHPVPTMFQKIIYDGLIGDAYLRHFVVTYDLPHARLIFAPLPVSP